MSRLYPINLDIERRLCVVIGGGVVAERKVSGLLEAGADVLVVSPDATSGLRDYAASGAIRHREGRYAPEDLVGACLVFAATNVRETNMQVARDAQRLGVPVN